jgi:large subunit ribosomal protein L21
MNSIPIGSGSEVLKMYAIIKAGGKQYTVKPGDVLRVEKLDADLGAELKLTDVLMVGGEKTFIGDNAGKAIVTVVVTNQQRGPKIVIFKKKRRQGYRRTGGHRQPYTELFVKSITSPEGKTANADAKPKIFNPEKRAEKQAKREEILRAKRLEARRARNGGEVSVAETKAPKKRPAVKKAGASKKTAAKKTGVKKTAAKKKAATKKTK